MRGTRPMLRKHAEWMLRWGSTASAVVAAGAMVFCLFAWAGILRTRGYAALTQGSFVFIWLEPPLDYHVRFDYFEARSMPRRWTAWLVPRVEHRLAGSGPGQTSVSIPLAYVLLPAATVSYVLWSRHRRGLPFAGLGMCPKCRYDLRGIPVSDDGVVRCPECGRA